MSHAARGREGGSAPGATGMGVDVAELHDFYASPLGEMASRLVTRAVEEAWPNREGLRVLGLGYAVPYLAALRSGCGCAWSFMPAGQGIMPWPHGDRSASALVDPTMMPLPDGSVDRVLLAHALEAVESPAELMHEVWRVLAPGGRMIAIVPNRRGLWARIDRTPFGQGQPFSRSQLRRLLGETHFLPERWAETLYTPPFRNRFLLRGAPFWEECGAGMRLPFAGLHVVEARKHLERPIAIGRTRRRRTRRVRPVLVPVPATRSEVELQ